MKQKWKSLAYLNVGLGVLLISIYWLFFYQPDLVFFSEKSTTKVGFFTDHVDGGNSAILDLVNQPGFIEMKCSLGEGFAYPYTGLEIEVPNNAVLDISAYNVIQLNSQAENMSNLFVYFHVKEKNIKDTLNRLVLRRVYSDLQVSEKFQKKELSIGQFVTPNWWYELVQQPKSDFGKPDYKNLRSISITTGINVKRNEVVTFRVSDIVLKRDNTLVVCIFVCIQMVFAGFSFLYYKYLSRKPKPSLIEINYKPVLVSENDREKEPEYLSYIHSNYDNPDLTLIHISQATGISQRIISEGISEKFECNVKSYINRVRINEAKRLLLSSSDLNMNEIAYKVGFNSSANFNRVFKAITSQNPSEFLQSSKSD
jgi:AraC-like DNA-binding protein